MSKMSKAFGVLSKSAKAIKKVTKNPMNPKLKTYEQLKAERESWKKWMSDYDDAGKAIPSAARKAQLRGKKVTETGNKLKAGLNKKALETPKKKGSTAAKVAGVSVAGGVTGAAVYAKKKNTEANANTNKVNQNTSKVNQNTFKNYKNEEKNALNSQKVATNKAKVQDNAVKVYSNAVKVNAAKASSAAQKVAANKAKVEANKKKVQANKAKYQ